MVIPNTVVALDKNQVRQYVQAAERHLFYGPCYPHRGEMTAFLFRSNVFLSMEVFLLGSLSKRLGASVALILLNRDGLKSLARSSEN